MADRLARRASSGAALSKPAPAALTAYLEVAARYGIRFTTYEHDGRVRICFDVESARMSFGRVALLGDAAFVARPHCGMGVSKAAGDAMALIHALGATENDVSQALEQYNRTRVPFGTEVVRHAQRLGAHLGGSDASEARRHHTPRAVMREIAVPWENHATIQSERNTDDRSRS